jgi:predicted glycosyltransferase
MTRVLFDVSHPAHVHLFRHAITDLDERGDTIHVTSREKDLTTELLDAYGISHTPLSAKGDSKLSLISEWLGRELRMIKEVRTFDPDVIVGRLNPPVAHAATVCGSRSVIFDDSEKAIFPARITHPFADIICTPESFDRNLGANQRRYAGFHELAYLHPNRFSPDPSVLKSHGIDPDTDFAVLRFVSWGAHHDVNQRGLSREGKQRLVRLLSDQAEVYITSEEPLPDEFEPYRLPLPPEHIHQLLAHADIYVGDSQTMATEAAVLGTPAVRSNTFAGIDDMSNFVCLEEEYELLYSTANEDRAISIVADLLDQPDLQVEWEHRRRNLIDDTVDVTSFIIDTIDEVTAS